MSTTLYVLSPAPALDVDAAHELRYLMTHISWAHLAAMWAQDLELLLWAMLEGGPRQLGFFEVPLTELEQLQRLHELAGGWWTFQEGDFTFLPTAVWETHVLRRKYFPKS